MRTSWLIAGLLIAFYAPPARGADDLESVYHKAYYLEIEEGNPEGAARLYEEVAKSSSAPTRLVEKAKRRLAACREQARASDLARLMPPDVLAYLELRKPGEHVGRLLELAGLAGEAGQQEGAASPLLAVSPRLIEGLKGLDGAAVSITSFDPERGIPSGLAILNPGKNDLLHGLLETALSGAAGVEELRAAGPVNGHPSYSAPFATIVVTERLIFAGNPRELVEDAVRRLDEGAPSSLSASPAFSEASAQRGDSLAFVYLDAKRGIEIFKQQTSRDGQPGEEYQIAQAFGDIESLKWAALNLGATPEGVAVNLWLELEEGNRCLPYHLIRTPSFGREALRAVPSGAAAVLAMGFAEEKGAGPSPNAQRAAAARYVTGLDVGRELFANIREAFFFVLPPQGDEDGEPKGKRGPPIPDAGIVLTVKDPAKSHALWKTLLGIPSVIDKNHSKPAVKEVVDGNAVQVFTMPGDVQVYLAELPDRVVLATQRSVLSRAFQASDEKGSVLDDPGFAKSLGRVTADSSKLALVAGGRAWQIGAPLSGVGARDADQVGAFLENATLSVITDETPTTLHATVSVGIPKIGSLLRQIVEESKYRPRGNPARHEKKL